MFVAELGVTPAHFVEQARVEVARLLLQSSAGSLKEAASRSGFGGPDSMRRSFLRTMGVAPSDYSARFRRQAG